MFRISVTVDDDDLGQVIKVLHQLKDVIIKIEAPQPVTAVGPKERITTSSKLSEMTPSSTLFENVANTILSSKADTIKTDVIKDMIVEAGGSKNSISYCLKKLSASKVLRPTKRRGHYIVNQS